MKLAGYISLGLLLVGASFMAGTRWARRHAGRASQQQAVARLRLPDAPAVPVGPPGRLSLLRHAPRARARGRRGEPAAAGDGTALPAGAVQVSPERQQTIGVRLGVVERVSGTRTLRTTGRVAPNENAVYPLVAGADGWCARCGARRRDRS